MKTLNYVEPERDANGYLFAKASDGTTIFGEGRAETGLKQAPIKLSEGIQKDGKGYGLKHIKAGHGKQIEAAGYTSTESFVEAVAKNYKEVKAGKERDGNKTYLLELVDDHNNTLFVELSTDGNY